MDVHAMVREQCTGGCDARGASTAGLDVHRAVRTAGLHGSDGRGFAGSGAGWVPFAGSGDPPGGSSEGEAVSDTTFDPRLVGGGGSIFGSSPLAGSCGILPPRSRVDAGGEAVGCCIDDVDSRAVLTEQERTRWVVSGAFPLLQPNWRFRKSNSCEPATDDCDVCDFPGVFERTAGGPLRYLAAIRTYAEATRMTQSFGRGRGRSLDVTIPADDDFDGIPPRRHSQDEPGDRMRWVAYSGLSYLVAAAPMVDWAMCLHRVPTPVRSAVNTLLDDLRALADRVEPLPGLRFVGVDGLWVGGRHNIDGARSIWHARNADVLRVRQGSLDLDALLSETNLPGRRRESIIVDVVLCHPLLRRWYRLAAPVFEPLRRRPGPRRLNQHRCASVGFAYHLLLGLFEALTAGTRFAPWWHHQPAWQPGVSHPGETRPGIGYAALSSTCSRFVKAANAFLWAATTQDGSSSDAMMAERACAVGFNDTCLPYSDQIRVWPVGCTTSGEGVVGRPDAPDANDGCAEVSGVSPCDALRWASRPTGTRVTGPAQPGVCALGAPWSEPNPTSDLSGLASGQVDQPRVPWE